MGHYAHPPPTVAHTGSNPTPTNKPLVMACQHHAFTTEQVTPPHPPLTNTSPQLSTFHPTTTTLTPHHHQYLLLLDTHIHLHNLTTQIQHLLGTQDSTTKHLEGLLATQQPALIQTFAAQKVQPYTMHQSLHLSSKTPHQLVAHEMAGTQCPSLPSCFPIFP